VTISDRECRRPDTTGRTQRSRRERERERERERVRERERERERLDTNQEWPRMGARDPKGLQTQVISQRKRPDKYTSNRV
jgi:hypothetical protein